MAFGGFARYEITLHPMAAGLKQSRVCVDGKGVGYLTDAGAFLPCEWLPKDVEKAISEHVTKTRGAAPNVVRLPNPDAVDALTTNRENWDGEE